VFYDGGGALEMELKLFLEKTVISKKDHYRGATRKNLL